MPKCLPWWNTTTPPRPDCRISAHPGREVPSSAASNSHPVAAGSSCHRRIVADTTVGTDRCSSARCCSPNTSRTETTSTRRRSSRARSDCGKAPNDGAYPPVRRECSPRPSSCTRCRLCSSRDDAVCRFRRSSSAAVEVAAVVANCCARCCSYIGTDWRGCRCPKTTTATPSRF